MSDSVVRDHRKKKAFSTSQKRILTLARKFASVVEIQFNHHESTDHSTQRLFKCCVETFERAAFDSFAGPGGCLERFSTSSLGV